MEQLMPKEFIQSVLIGSIGDIHLRHPYVSFSVMAIGVEFWGKCLNCHEDWNHYERGLPKNDFD